jgi:hypothetical protein
MTLGAPFFAQMEIALNLGDRPKVQRRFRPVNPNGSNRAMSPSEGSSMRNCKKSNNGLKEQALVSAEKGELNYFRRRGGDISDFQKREPRCHCSRFRMLESALIQESGNPADN